MLYIYISFKIFVIIIIKAVDTSTAAACVIFD